MLFDVDSSADCLHPAVDDSQYWTETLWLGFTIAEAKVSGVVNLIIRSNVGVASLGVHVWDDGTAKEGGMLYSQVMPHEPIPSDLRAFSFGDWFSYRCTQPLSTYEVSYDDKVELKLALRYEGLSEPVLRSHGEPVPTGYTQGCHVTGTVTLNGDVLDVDCYEFRASSFHNRPDFRTKPRPENEDQILGGTDTYGYSKLMSFQMGTHGNSHTTEANGGYLIRDGEMSPLASGTRTVARRSPDGNVQEIIIDLVDEAGREEHLVGSVLNRGLLKNPSFTAWLVGITWQSEHGVLFGVEHEVLGAPARRFRSDR